MSKLTGHSILAVCIVSFSLSRSTSHQLCVKVAGKTHRTGFGGRLHVIYVCHVLETISIVDAWTIDAIDPFVAIITS